MFDALPAIDTFTIQFDLDGTRDADPDYAAPLPDTGALLAAIGLPAHAIREVLGSRTRMPARTAESRKRGAWRNVKGEGIERGRFPFTNPMS